MFLVLDNKAIEEVKVTEIEIEQVSYITTKTQIETYIITTPPVIEKQQVCDLTDEEIEMIAYVLANEVGNMDYTYKISVAEIIRNRILSENFPDTIYEVLHQENQFTAINNYYNPIHYPDNEVYDAIYEVFNNNSDFILGAVFYRNIALSATDYNGWWNSLEITKTYTANSYGIDYTTTYYK